MLFRLFWWFLFPSKKIWKLASDFNISRAWAWKRGGANNFPPFLGLYLTPPATQNIKKQFRLGSRIFLKWSPKMPIFCILNLGNEVPNLVSKVQNAKNGHFRVPFLKNSGTDPKLFFDVLSGWGGQVQPQKWWKIVGTAPFPSPRPGNIKVWRAIFRIF